MTPTEPKPKPWPAILRAEPRAGVSRAGPAGGVPTVRLPYRTRVVVTARPRSTVGAASAWC